MSSYNAICQRAMNAIATYLGTKTFSWSPTIFTGIDNESRTLPAIICQCQSANHFPPPVVGNWQARCRVMIRENADDTDEADHLSHAGEVIDYILMDNIAASLTTAGTFTAQLVTIEAQGYDIQERSWVSWIDFTLHCKGY